MADDIAGTGGNINATQQELAHVQQVLESAANIKNHINLINSGRKTALTFNVTNFSKDFAVIGGAYLTRIGRCTKYGHGWLKNGHPLPQETIFESNSLSTTAKGVIVLEIRPLQNQLRNHQLFLMVGGQVGFWRSSKLFMALFQTNRGVSLLSDKALLLAEYDKLHKSKKDKRAKDDPARVRDEKHLNQHRYRQPGAEIHRSYRIEGPNQPGFTVVARMNQGRPGKLCVILREKSPKEPIEHLIIVDKPSPEGLEDDDSSRADHGEYQEVVEETEDKLEEQEGEEADGATATQGLAE